MEAQFQRLTHDHHHYEEDPHKNAGLHSGGEDEEEHNHGGEKKSVLKKVKDKAKKIKDTIKKHGAHGHEHEYRHDQISEGEDDEDEETVNAPEVHGAPMYESAFISGTKLPTQTGINLENPTVPREDRYNPNMSNEVYPDVGDHGHGVTKTSNPPDNMYNPNARNEVYPDVGVGHGVTKTPSSPEDRYNPNVRNEMYPHDVGDDSGVTRAPEIRYNPNIRNEVYPDIGDGHGVTKTPVVSGDRYNPNIKDEEYPDVGVGDGGVTRISRSGKMGTDLGGSPVEAPQPELESPLSTVPDAIGMEQENVAEPTVKIGPLVDLVEDPQSPKNHPGEIPLSNYQTKVVDPTGEGGKEAEVAPLVQRLDNLRIREKSETDAGLVQVSHTGSHNQFAPQSTPTDNQFNPESNPIGASKKSESPKSFDPAKPESMPRDTVAGKISAATSVITDKAVSAKNVVASKFGYSGHHQEGQDSSKKAPSKSVTECGGIAEKLAPVYEKVAGAGSAMMSKVQRGGGAEHGGGDTAVKDTDRVVSVKEYLAEKFSPGDEDEALSEVITDAIHKKKEGVRRTGGQVKKSESMAPHLGTGKESETPAMAAGSENTGGGVVDRVKGAVSSWLGMSSGTQTAQHSLHPEYGSAPGGGGRLSEPAASSRGCKDQTTD